MDGAQKFKWHNHAPLGTVCHPYAGTSYDWPVYQITNLYIHHYENMKDNEKCKKLSGLGF